MFSRGKMKPAGQTPPVLLKRRSSDLFLAVVGVAHVTRRGRTSSTTSAAGICARAAGRRRSRIPRLAGYEIAGALRASILGSACCSRSSHSLGKHRARRHQTGDDKSEAYLFMHNPPHERWSPQREASARMRRGEEEALTSDDDRGDATAANGRSLAKIIDRSL